MSTRIDSKRLGYTTHAYRCVIEAYDALKACGAIHAAARVKACLKSVEGAVRHAERLNYLGDEDLAKMRKIRRHRVPKKCGIPKAVDLNAFHRRFRALEASE